MPVGIPGGGEGGGNAPSGGVGLTAEQVRDTVAAFVREGTNITIVHDDAADTLTISSTASGGGGGLDPEAVRDTVAAFLRAAAGSGLSVTHDDNANTLTLGYTLPAATETHIGGVRNVSIEEASAPGGLVFRAWSSAMITKLVQLWRTVVSQAEAVAGTATVARFWTALRVRQAAEAAAKAVIPAALMELLHNGLSSAVQTEQRIGDFTLLNDGNVVYLITVGTATEFFAGDDISALREADAHTLDGVTVYSNAARHLLLKQPSNASREVKVWLVEDVEAFAAIAARFLPTVTQPDAEEGTSRQRRIWTAERVLQAIRANRDGDAFIAAAVEAGELTLTRRSGTNPVDLPIGGSGSGDGSFRLRQVGTRYTETADGDNMYRATGITMPALADDEVVYLRYAGPGEGDAPTYGIMLGSLYAALTVKTAGSSVAAGDVNWERLGINSVASFHIAKTADDELLLASDSSTAPFWVELYRTAVGLGGAAGGQELVAGTPSDPWAFDFRAAAADGRTAATLTSGSLVASTPLNFRPVGGVIRPMTVGDFEADAVYNVEATENDTTPRATSSVILSGREIVDRAGVVTGTVGGGIRSTSAADRAGEIQVPAIRLGFFRLKASSSDADADTDQVVLRASGANFVILIKKLLTGGGGTRVEANPTGSAGATLTRLQVAGRDYNLPGAGVIAGAKLNLQDVASVAIGTSYGGTLFKPTLTGARWNIGGFTLDGDNIVFPVAGLYQIHTEAFLTGTGGWNTVFTRYRIERAGVVIAASTSEGSNIHRGSQSNNQAVIEHDDWHLVEAGDKLIIDFRGASAESYAVSGSQSFAVIVGFASPAAAPAPATHNRYIGWSAAQNPTAGEFGAASVETDDTLDVPALPAAFATAGGAYVFLVVPKSAGVPTGIYRSGNIVNQIGAFTRVNDWTPQGGSAHYVYASNAALSAASLADATYRIDYGDGG